MSNAQSAPESFFSSLHRAQEDDQLIQTLNLYPSISWNDAKLVSLLCQHTQSVHVPDKSINLLIDVLRTRSGVVYGENLPYNAADVGQWCISRLESWAHAAGMETFKDENQAGGVTVMLAGKVLVVDVDFAFCGTDVPTSNVKVSSVKTSYAASNTAVTVGSSSALPTSLDAFLLESIQRFCGEAQKALDKRDSVVAAHQGKHILAQLRYLVMLDRLAERKDDGGIRWFVDMDQLCTTVENVAKNEAETVATSLAAPRAPLDIFLVRAHGLPLPYLISPAISFLTYVAPPVYLSHLCSITSSASNNNPLLPQFDIPLQAIRSLAASLSRGITVATLSLTLLSEGRPFLNSIPSPAMNPRPAFPIAPAALRLEHLFLQTSESPSADSGETIPMQHIWMLDFTNGKKTPGIVMSQTRMRAVEHLVNLSGMENLTDGSVMSFGMGSWVDLLLNPETDISAARYNALLTSPNSLHPPLHLRLTTPQEPGFTLERVPVRSLKEVWGILEIVREQCWLNETLLSCKWVIADLDTSEADLPPETEATAEDLHALLTGTMTPRKIPVNVFLPSGTEPTDALFDLGTVSIWRPRIVMTFPERHPIWGTVEISVAFDETKSRGVRVDVQGALGADITLETFEEICRRGGTFTLAGRVWASAHAAVM